MKDYLKIIQNYYLNNETISYKSILIDKKNRYLVLWVDPLVNIELLEKNFLPKLEENINLGREENNILSFEVIEKDILKTIDEKLYVGFPVVYAYKTKKIYCFKMQNIPKRTPAPIPNEITTLGAQDCFVENIDTNLGLIYYRYRNKDLITENYVIGEYTRTRLSLLYSSSRIDDDLLKEVKKRITNMNIENGINVSSIQRHLTHNKKSSLFPLMSSTYKPDFCVDALLKGKFVILVDGIPIASIGPATLGLFISYHYSSQENKATNIFEKVLSYICIIIAIFMTGFITCIITFNPEFLPYLLLSNIYSTSKGVFLPFAVQIILAELLFQIFRLAGTKLPTTIGNTIVIIGSLVVSRIGVETGLFGPYVLIITALAIVANYAISNNNSFNIGFSIARLIIIFFSVIFGLLGFVLSSLLVIIYLCSLSSFGVPYLYPLAPFDKNKFKLRRKNNEKN